MISLIQGRQSPPHLQDEALIPLREPALSARHLQRSVSRQVPGPYPPGDLHHPQGRGDRQDAAALPPGQEERDGGPRLLHVQPLHPLRVGGVRGAVLSQVCLNVFWGCNQLQSSYHLENIRSLLKSYERT